MADWNERLNPIPAEGKFYLKIFKEQASCSDNPVEDLTEIMTDCYEALLSIAKNYSPTGDTRQDNSINRLKVLFERWPVSELENLREHAAADSRKPSHAPPPPPSPSVFEEPETKPEPEPEPEPMPEPEPEPEPERRTVPECSEEVTKPIMKSCSTPALSATIKEVNGSKSSKNEDYFHKLKEDEALARKKQEEEEARMNPEALKKLQEERRLAEEHDSSKTAHLSKLGSKYMPAKKKTSTGEIILERGGGGRGRGRGRGH